jgi:AcrR family transcriptional regulator
MCPRPYRSDRRKKAAGETRARILNAARTLLSAPGGITEFSINAIAQEAGVARMTVYHQFGSKVGLLEALFDDLGVRGEITRIASVFMQADPLIALSGFIEVFASFWNSDRLVIRRLRALSVLDPDFEVAMRGRDDRRWGGVRVMLQRLGERFPHLLKTNDAERILFALTSFETFDSLAANGTPVEVVPVVKTLVKTALGLKCPLEK